MGAANTIDCSLNGSYGLGSVAVWYFVCVVSPLVLAVPRLRRLRFPFSMVPVLCCSFPPRLMVVSFGLNVGPRLVLVGALCVLRGGGLVRP